MMKLASYLPLVSAFIFSCTSVKNSGPSQALNASTNDNVVNIYAKNELVLAHYWVHHLDKYPEMTLSESVLKWQEDGEPKLKLKCTIDDKGKYNNSRNDFLKTAEVEIGAEEASISIKRRHKRIEVEVLLAPIEFAANSSQVTRAFSDEFRVQWKDQDSGEADTILHLKLTENEDEQGQDYYFGDLDQDPNGASGLTLGQDYRYGIRCEVQKFKVN